MAQSRLVPAPVSSAEPGATPASTARRPLILIVPGDDPEVQPGWLAGWERDRADCQRLDLPHWEHPHRNTWVNHLNLAIHRAARPVVLVAHGLGCLAVAWWAEFEQAEPESPVVAALMVNPPDVDRPGSDPRLARFTACPRRALPFATTVVGGIFAPREQDLTLRALARDWDARFTATALPDRSAGDWPDGRRLIERLVAGSGGYAGDPRAGGRALGDASRLAHGREASSPGTPAAIRPAPRSRVENGAFAIGLPSRP